MIAADDPRHGHRAGYIAGCRESCCGIPHGRYQKRSRLRLLTEGTQIIPAAKTLARVQWWADRGVGLNAMCVAAGLGYGTLAELYAGDRDVCLRCTERAILAVTWDMLPPTTLCLSGLTQRRIYSLMASGHTLAWISEQVGDGLPISGRWRKQERVRLSLARDVARVAYHAPAVGPSRMTAAKVQKRGHLPIAGWDDPGWPAVPLGWEPAADVVERDPADVDPFLVADLLAGAWGLAVEATPAERAEVCRRWHAAGRSLSTLGRVTGWAPSRYFRVRDEAVSA